MKQKYTLWPCSPLLTTSYLQRVLNVFQESSYLYIVRFLGAFLCILAIWPDQTRSFVCVCVCVVTVWDEVYFWYIFFPDVSLANEDVLTVLIALSMSLWKREFQVQPHYSVFLARRLHTSGWSISRVINKITLVHFWQASVIATNELSTSQINQS